MTNSNSYDTKNHVTQKKHRELILNLFVQIFIEKCYSIITSFNFD